MDRFDHYNFEDFILDDSFREYVEGSNQESVDFWTTWTTNHPKKLAEVNKAKDVILVLQSHTRESFHTNKEEALQHLLSEIAHNEKPGITRRIFSSQWIRIAAAVLITTGLSWIIFNAYSNRKVSKAEILYTEIIVPIGEKSQIVLSDGSHVWLNSGTRFKYPVNFGNESRDVSLVGEAYFDVTRGRRTFTVNTHDARIEVIGTAFNVKSYPEDQKTQTTVVRGKVRVESKLKDSKSVLILHDQMAVIKDVPESGMQKESVGNIDVLNEVNTTAITSWKDQLLVFADESFEDITIKMERWFNMKISIDDDELKRDRYTGKFVNNETVYQVLEASKVTTPIEYKIRNDEIVITRKK